MNMDGMELPLGTAGNPTTSTHMHHDTYASNPSSQPPPGGRQSGNVTVYQTTGLDAYTSPIASSDGSGPLVNPRSCVTCRRRKVRCDKQMPCSNCRRALIPCVFPAPGRAPRQPRPKDPNAPPKTTSQREVELVKRLRKLEGIVEELSGQIEVESGGKGHSPAGSPSSPSHQPAAARPSASIVAQHATRTGSDRAQGSLGSTPKEGDALSEQGSEGSRKKDINAKLGRIVLNDHKGSTRYVSNGFWAKINDELDALRQDTQRLTDEESDESDYEETPDVSPPNNGGSVEDHHAFILGYRAADVDLRSCHPAIPSHAAFLWSVYQENVEPLIKLLHIPTVEGIMRDARKNTDRLSPGTQALVFAIYFAAVISLEPDETMANFNVSKDDLLRQYRFALEQSLARANFLHTSELVVLQAFAIFLLVVRRVDDSRFCWTLTGLVVRMAQGMGLHRDGSQFDLTPFETEMRRRVWWAILALDLRSAEEVGSDLSVHEASFDTQMPLNINDADISPSSTDFPTPCEGRSDTSVALARYGILVISRRFMTELVCKNADISPSEREQLLVDAYQRVEEKFLKHVVDETDSLYWMAAMIARIIVAKMCLHIYQSKIFTGNNPNLSDEIRDRIFMAAIEVVELGHKLNADPRCRQYRWLFMTYTNWHAIAFNLIELCRRPWSPLVERSWEAISTFDRDPVDLAKSGDHAAVFLPLRKLYLRARRHRAAELARLRGNLDEARRLDWEERTHPATGRFGPIPGDEGRMDQVREKWWSLVQPNGPSARGPNLTIHQQPPVAGGPPVSPVSQLSTAPTSDRAKSGTPSTGQMSLTDAAMEMLDDMITQPNPSLSMPALWPYIDMNDKTSVSLAMDGTNATANAQGQQPHIDDDALRQQAKALQAQATSGSNSPPPFLWSNAWGEPVAPGRLDEDEGAGAGDIDMLEGDFNWEDWGQTLQNFDMGGMQPPT